MIVHVTLNLWYFDDQVPMPVERVVEKVVYKDVPVEKVIHKP
jgi:hypothetical protein